LFRRTPILVDSWVSDLGADEVTLAHEVYDAAADDEYDPRGMSSR
jgi:hypothetical protein